MKKLISATLAASLALSLAACGSSASTDSVAASSEAASTESTAASSEAAESTAETSELAGTTLKVAASPTPHAEILNVAKEILAEQGIALDTNGALLLQEFERQAVCDLRRSLDALLDLDLFAGDRQCVADLQHVCLA